MRSRVGWIPLALLVLGLAATGLVLFLLDRAAEGRQRQRFEREADRVSTSLVRRVDAAIAVLQSGAAFVAVHGAIGEGDFESFVRHLQLRTLFAGIQGVGFAIRVPAADVDAFTDRQRRRPSHADFRVWPDDPAAERFPILYLEPLDARNRAALGYDMFTDPVRRAAMRCAADTGRPCASAAVTLVQEIDEDRQAGFLVFVPVYGASAPSTLEARRRELRGFVYAPIRGDDFVNGTLVRPELRTVSVELFDGPTASADARLAGPSGPPSDSWTTTRQLKVAGRIWTAGFRPEAGAFRGRPAGRLAGGAVLGIVVSCLLAGLAFTQLRAREVAARAAALELKQRDVASGILESITDAFYAVDHEWRFTYLNGRALDYFGMSADELLGRSIWEVFPQSRGTIFDREFRRAVRDRVPVTFETQSARTGRSVDVHAYPSEDGLSVYFQNVTERRRAQKQLEEHAAKIDRLNADLRQRVEEFQALLEVLPVGIGIALDPEARTIQTNRAFADILRLARGDNASLSAPGDERPRHFRVLQDGVEVPPHQLPLQRAAREGITIRDLQLEVVFEDGSRRQLLEYAAPLFDASGRPRGSVGAFVDVTDRAAAEETFRIMANNAPVLVWIADTAGRTTWFNEPWLRFTGRSMAAELGHGWRDGIHPDDRAHCEEAFGTAIASGTAFSIEFRLRRHDGAWRWMMYQGVPLRRADRHTGYIGSCVDITDRKAAELERTRLLDEVREADRMKDEFLATLSHELRTPLNAILGWTRMLRTGSLPPDRAARALEILERNAHAQTQLVEDILDMSRIVTGKLRLELRPLKLHDVLNAAVDAVRPAAEAKGVALIIEADPDTGRLNGDADRLQQAIWNLLTNAIKFTPSGGRVDVRLQRVGPQVEVSVTDTGIGMAPEFLPYIFHRFRQADAGSTRNTTGLGLGLSIVKHVIEAHGGTVQATSAGLGQGSCFRIRLPLPVVVDRAETAGARAGSQTGDEIGRETLALDHTRLKGTRVLAVDDESDSLALLVEVLEEAGAEVVAVSSAPAALERLRTWRPDVIVSDIGMPDMDGWELIRRVRLEHADGRPQIPAAALTAYARAEDRARALREGYQVHLSKPFEPAELVATIARLVGLAETSQV